MSDKELVTRFFMEGYQNRNYDFILECLSENYIVYNSIGSILFICHTFRKCILIIRQTRNTNIVIAIFIVKRSLSFLHILKRRFKIWQFYTKNQFYTFLWDRIAQAQPFMKKSRPEIRKQSSRRMQVQIIHQIIQKPFRFFALSQFFDVY